MCVPHLQLQSATASLEERKSQNEQLLQQNNALMTVNASQKSHMDGLQDRIKILSVCVWGCSTVN